MSQLPAVADLLDETAALNGLAPRHNGFHLEPRCRVCRNDTLRSKVNDLLATGASYAMILRALRDDNAKLDKPDRVTIDSIRNHTARHSRSRTSPSDLPGDPRTPGAGEPHRLRRGRGHRPHAHCVLRDGHGEEL